MASRIALLHVVLSPCIDSDVLLLTSQSLPGVGAITPHAAASNQGG